MDFPLYFQILRGRVPGFILELDHRLFRVFLVYFCPINNSGGCQLFVLILSIYRYPLPEGRVGEKLGILWVQLNFKGFFCIFQKANDFLRFFDFKLFLNFVSFEMIRETAYKKVFYPKDQNKPWPKKACVTGHTFQ